MLQSEGSQYKNKNICQGSQELVSNSVYTKHKQMIKLQKYKKFKYFLAYEEWKKQYWKM